MKLIAAKLTKIMKDCAYVQKTGYNDFHKYKYARAAAILEKANESMVENNVASKVLPRLTEFRDVTTAKGATEHLATVEVTVTLIDTESGETIDLVGMGSGQDAGDKAIMKAQTAALKYAWMMSLNIATGDDPEADTKTDEAGSPPANKAASRSTTAPTKAESPAKPAPASQNNPCTPLQQNQITSLWQDLGKSEAQLKIQLKKDMGVDSVEELTGGQAAIVVAGILGLIKAKKAKSESAA